MCVCVCVCVCARVLQLTQAQTGKFNVHVHVEYEWRLQNEDLDESDDEMEDKVSFGGPWLQALLSLCLSVCLSLLFAPHLKTETLHALRHEPHYQQSVSDNLGVFVFLFPAHPPEEGGAPGQLLRARPPLLLLLLVPKAHPGHPGAGRGPDGAGQAALQRGQHDDLQRDLRHHAGPQPPGLRTRHSPPAARPGPWQRSVQLTTGETDGSGLGLGPSPSISIVVVIPLVGIRVNMWYNVQNKYQFDVCSETRCIVWTLTLRVQGFRSIDRTLQKR